jgi:tRNA pseudouridine-54 N-methylase
MITKRRFVVLLGRPPPRCKCSVFLDALPGSGRWDMIARCVSSALFVSNGTRRDTEIVFIFSPQLDYEGGQLEGERVYVTRVHGDLVRHLRPDERSIAAILLKAMFPVPCIQATKSKRTKVDPITHFIEKKCMLLAEQQHKARDQTEMEGTALVDRCAVGVTCSVESSLAAVLDACALEAHGGTLLELRLDAEEKVTTKLGQLRDDGGEGVITFILGDDQGYSLSHESALSALSTAAVRRSVPVKLSCDMLLTSHCQVILHSLLDAEE